MAKVQLLGTRYYVIDLKGNRVFGSKNKAEADAYLAKNCKQDGSNNPDSKPGRGKGRRAKKKVSVKESEE